VSQQADVTALTAAVETALYGTPPGDGGPSQEAAAAVAAVIGAGWRPPALTPTGGRPTVDVLVDAAEADAVVKILEEAARRGLGPVDFAPTLMTKLRKRFGAALDRIVDPPRAPVQGALF
jgi:hypothetical protein